MTLRLICLLFVVAVVMRAQAQDAPPIVRHQTPKPETARPAGLISVSTAESGGLRNREPLRRLPSFSATTLDGRTADIAAFQQPKHWLLLYRREDCVPCDRMLSTLAASNNTLLKSGSALVVVVANNGTRNSNRLDSLRARFASTGSATWLEDSSGAASKALKPQGTPVLYALSGDRVQWSMPGLGADPALVERMASAWVNSEDPKIVLPASTTGASISTKP